MEPENLASIAHDPYHPANRPVVRQQCNPLMIPPRYRDWAEVWFVGVPGTPYHWVRRHVPPGTTLEVIAYPSQEEAIQHAQELWQQVWQFKPLSQDAQELWKNGIMVSPRVERIFTVKTAEHLALYQSMRATLAETYPGVTVHFRGEAARLAFPSLADPSTPQDLSQHLSPDRMWNTDTIDALLDSWQDDPEVSSAQPHSGEPETDPGAPERQDAWVALRLNPSDTPPRWVLWAPKDATHSDVVFWTNATGHIAIWEAESEQDLQEQLPRHISLNAKIGYGMTLDPATAMTAMHRQALRPMHPDVATWLAHRDTLQDLITQDPAIARSSKVALLQATDAVTQVVFPPTGVLARSPLELTRAYLRLKTAIAQRTPPGASRDAALAAAQRWEQASDPLRVDSLGIFQKGRLPDLVFDDPRQVKDVPYHEGLPRSWAVHQLPSGRCLIGALNQQDEIVYVDLKCYANPDDAIRRIRIMDGMPVPQNRPDLVKEWQQRLTARFPDSAPQMIKQAMTINKEYFRTMVQAAQEQYRLQRAQHTAPTPRPHTPPTVYLTPIGGGRAVAWMWPQDPSDKDYAPRLVRQVGTKVVDINPHSGWYLPKSDPAHPRQWADIPPSRRPWIIEAPGPAALRDLVAQAQAQAPAVQIVPALLPDDGHRIIAALAERYGIKPEPFVRVDEAFWLRHPAPVKGGAYMASTRQWLVTPKPEYPGEYHAISVLRPLPGPQGIFPPLLSRQADDLDRALDQRQLLHHVFEAIPPDAIDYFDRHVAKMRQVFMTQKLDQDPHTLWKVLPTLPRQRQRILLADLKDDLREAQLPTEDVRRYSRVLVGAMRGIDPQFLAALDSPPTSCRPSGPRQDRTLADDSFAQDTVDRLGRWIVKWMADHPKDWERIQRTLTPAQPSLAPAGSPSSPTLTLP